MANAFRMWVKRDKPLLSNGMVTDIAADCPENIERIGKVRYSTVVMSEEIIRSDACENSNANQDKSSNEEFNPLDDFLFPWLVIDAGDTEQVSRDDASDDNPENSLESHQFHGFSGGGFQHILDHGGINRDAEVEHRIIRNTGYQDERNQENLAKVWNDGNVQDDEKQQEQEDGNGNTDKVSFETPVKIHAGKDIPPQSKIQDRSEIEGNNDVDPQAFHM